ncbi:hypothetical protein L0938_12325 [Paracidovorax citrulli]
MTTKFARSALLALCGAALIPLAGTAAAAGADTQYYCMAWNEDTGERLPAPKTAGVDAQDGYYKVKGGKDAEAQIQVQKDAYALVKKYNPDVPVDVNQVECDLSPGS